MLVATQCNTTYVSRVKTLHTCSRQYSHVIKIPGGPYLLAGDIQCIQWNRTPYIACVALGSLKEVFVVLYTSEGHVHNIPTIKGVLLCIHSYKLTLLMSKPLAWPDNHVWRFSCEGGRLQTLFVNELLHSMAHNIHVHVLECDCC